MSGQDKIYEVITERFIEQLRQGVVPWRKPWRIAGGGWPLNIKSRKPYRGVNPIVLAMAGYSSPWWGTFDQMATASGMVKVPANNRRGYRWESPDGKPRGVRKGEHHTVVIFWKQLYITEADPVTGKPVRKRIPMLRYYRVFNSQQVDGLPEKYLPTTESDATVDFVGQMTRAKEIHNGYIDRTGLDFVEAGDSAHYDLRNTIHVPPRSAFDDQAEFWSTAFHEDTHSTGHKDRLNRPGIENFDHFGSGQYSKEELVAEIGSAMLMATAGIESEATFQNSAGYVGGWLKKLQSDHKIVIQAAAQAQHAVDHILDIQYEDEEHEES